MMGIEYRPTLFEKSETESLRSQLDYLCRERGNLRLSMVNTRQRKKPIPDDMVTLDQELRRKIGMIRSMLGQPDPYYP